MKVQFYWSGPGSRWPAICAILLGAVLMIFPGMSGKVFCWALAIGALVYAASCIWQYISSRRMAVPAGSLLTQGVIFAAIGLFCLLRPVRVLSFLPFLLGLILLLVGLSKLPFAIDAYHMKTPSFRYLLVSSIAPLVLGAVLLWNPFGAVKGMIAFFGLSLIIAGVSDLLAGRAAK